MVVRLECAREPGIGPRLAVRPYPEILDRIRSSRPAPCAPPPVKGSRRTLAWTMSNPCKQTSAQVFVYFTVAYRKAIYVPCRLSIPV